MKIEEEPVLTYGLIVTVISAGIAMLMALNVITLTQEQFAAVMAFVSALAILGAAVVRKYVTPLSDPQDNDGNKLVPVTHIEAGTYVQGNVETAEDFVGRDRAAE